MSGKPVVKTGPTPSGVMRSPRTVAVEITAGCNLRCLYCYYFHNPAVDYRDLPTDSWLRFFDELGSLGVMNVILAGGEPFTRKDLRDLLEGIVRNRMRFSLLSNGTLIDDETADFIAGTSRCEYVQVSVDGSCADTHDSCRGKGSFEGALRGIRILQRHGAKVAVRVTIHRHNVEDLENIARLLLEELGLPGFGTNSAGYLGRCALNADSILLTTRERQTAMATLMRLTEKYPGRLRADAGPLAEGLMWGRMEHARVQRAPAFHNGGHLTGCGCTRSEISIRADGTIVPCSMLAHIELGRIDHESLAEVWQNNADLNGLRNRHSIPLTEFEYCSDCPYIPYCTGNCPGLAYALTGRTDQPSPDACLRRFCEAGGTVL